MKPVVTFASVISGDEVAKSRVAANAKNTYVIISKSTSERWLSMKLVADRLKDAVPFIRMSEAEFDRNQFVIVAEAPF